MGQDEPNLDQTEEKVDQTEKKVEEPEEQVDQPEENVEEPENQSEKQEDQRDKEIDQQEKTTDQPEQTTDLHDETEIEVGMPLAEEDSICDWHPPPEVVQVQSESIHIPSPLPSLEGFMAHIYELEKAEKHEDAETALSDGEEEAEEEEEEIEEADDRLSIEKEEDDGAIIEEEKVLSEDDLLGTKHVEIKKPKERPKPQTAIEQFGWGAIQADLDSARKKENAYAEERLTIYLQESTEMFITNLIDNVVETCEYEDPDEILRQRLDKPEILRDLDSKIGELDAEQHMRLLLNRKVVDFFLRKKSLRQLTDDPPEDVLHIIRKYRDGLALLNYYKGLELDMKNTIEANVLELSQQKRELEEIAEKKTNEFFQAIKDVLGADYNERMEQLAETSTRKIRNMQKEISSVRFVLIQRQNTLAVLQEDCRNFEDLGNGLKMSDFEALQTETQALRKKIEEKNNELNRLHQRRIADVQSITHYREKQTMMRTTISAQQEFIEDLIEDKKSYREYMNALKLRRGAIRKEFKKISFASGLLDKNDLLLDYDATKDKINALKTKISTVKAEQLAMDERMKEMKKNIRT